MLNQDGWFGTGDVNEMFETIRVPAPSNTAATLGNLARKDLVVRRTRQPTWSLTPRGRKTAQELIGEIDLAKIAAQLAELPGAEVAPPEVAPGVEVEKGTRQTVLPPGLAPPNWAPGITELLDRYPFETNVLCMTRFPREYREDDPIGGVIDTSRDALDAHGLRLHLATDAIVDDTLIANVAAYMWGCQYGLALLENRVDEGLNYNVLIEVGAMVMAGRRTALLKDTTTPALPTDFVGRIYKPVDFGDLDTVSRAAHWWAADDLGLGRCPTCPR